MIWFSVCICPIAVAFEIRFKAAELAIQSVILFWL